MDALEHPGTGPTTVNETNQDPPVGVSIYSPLAAKGVFINHPLAGTGIKYLLTHLNAAITKGEPW